ncbi:extensin family protein [Ciceribacter thiooxidans]|uniref:Extensin family protein n=1 Tax=Ciceribacter thiooxidans TaxID=1969821 RepID=A0ABV7I539_9HYPH
MLDEPISALVGNDLAVISHLCDRAAAFQRALNAAACLYFTTVLSPGSDDAHRNHMHLDVMKRTGGYRYCR